jgi:uncharacterized protein (TIGR02284 family)
MARENTKVISRLNDLIEICKDGEEGFRESAQAIKDPHLQSLFQDFSLQRAQMAGELQSEVRRIGGTPESQGSAAGAAHRGWINLKSAMTGQDDAAIIAECERGEDVAKEAFSKAVSEGLPEPTASLIQRQSRQVKEAHDRIRALELAHQG